MARRPAIPAKMPTESSLHDAALAYLGRYAATQAGLVRVLDRRVARWAASSEAGGDGRADLRAKVRGIVARLVASGAVSDTAFAHARSRSLQRAGKSGRAIGAHLAARGVAREVAAEQAPADPEHELAAAVIHARKRRMGPFRTADEAPETRRREFSSMARAGFTQGVASRALRLTRDEAEALIATFRAGL